MSKIDIGNLTKIHDELEYNAKTLLSEITSEDGVTIAILICVCDTMRKQIESIFDIYSCYVKGRYKKDDSDSFSRGTPNFVKSDYTKLYSIAETLFTWSTVDEILVSNPDREDVINLLSELIDAVDDYKRKVLDYISQ